MMPAPPIRQSDKISQPERRRCRVACGPDFPSPPLPVQCGFIRSHEFRRPGQSGKGNVRTAAAPQIPARLAVTINIAMRETGRLAHHVNSFHGFVSRVAPPSGKPSNASSSMRRSHTLRPSMRFGGGILPSLTISSNLVGLTDVSSVTNATEATRLDQRDVWLHSGGHRNPSSRLGLIRPLVANSLVGRSA